MRILMISGVPGKAEAGVAGIVYNLAKELGDLGHSVKPIFLKIYFRSKSGLIGFVPSNLPRRSRNISGRYAATTTWSTYTHLSVSGTEHKGGDAARKRDLPT